VLFLNCPSPIGFFFIVNTAPVIMAALPRFSSLVRPSFAHLIPGLHVSLCARLTLPLTPRATLFWSDSPPLPPVDPLCCSRSPFLFRVVFSLSSFASYALLFVRCGMLLFFLWVMSFFFLFFRLKSQLLARLHGVTIFLSFHHMRFWSEFISIHPQAPFFLRGPPSSRDRLVGE